MKINEKILMRFGIYGMIAYVLFILTIVFGVLSILVALIASITLYTSQFDLTEIVNFLLDAQLPGSKIMMPNGFTITPGIIITLTINLALGFALSAYVLKNVATMFKMTVKLQTPFSQGAVKCIKSIGFAFLIYTGIILLMSLINSLVVSGLGFSMDVDWGLALIGLLVLALGEMFDFGSSLQQDSESIL